MVKKILVISATVIVIMVFFGIILSIPYLIGDFNTNPTCGNGVQDAGEDELTCAEDFNQQPSECGNGICGDGETNQNCPVDCGEVASCGNANCDNGESKQGCPQDCGVSNTIVESCIFEGDWIKEYDCMRRAAGIDDKYLNKDSDLDFDAQNIQQLIREAESEESAKEAAKTIGKLVYQKVNYNAELSSGSDCLNVKASEVLDRGWGWCSTMSKVDIAALRGLGVAARTAQGCLTFTQACVRFAVLQGVVLPKTSPVLVEDGKYVVGGGLHGWVEVWLPNEGWVLMESTNGALFETQCANYQRLKESVRLDREDFCFINDDVFIQFCSEF